MIRFNFFIANNFGVQTTPGQIVHNNVFADSSQETIRVENDSNVFIVNNTLVTTTGDNIVILQSSNVEVVNNILRTIDGANIDVALDGATGFFSDFNDLLSVNGPVVRYVGVDFNTLADWKQVGPFDQNSIGTTNLSPDFFDPTFMWEARHDLEVFQALAGRRFDSPTIDAGNPLQDVGVAFDRLNLLTNPSFASGLAGWVASAGAGTTPSAFNHGPAFTAGANLTGFAAQSLDLLALGFTEAELDSQDLVAIFGARFRTMFEIVPDLGAVTISFLTEPMGLIDPEPELLGEFTVNASGAADRWELVGDKVSIPVGTRFITIRFEANGATGPQNNALIDST
ncbi:MAG: right-handed parallel beta-helix repeat-containing protein, partial [Planctomycetota bacterium]|nr:right-handed parallel beta-helix repeat-containing protein [Planctomycetota bacterium]